MGKRKNLKVSIQTYDILDTLQRDLEAICETNLSQDKIIRILLCVKSIEEQVIHLSFELGIPSKTKRRSRIESH